MARQIPLDRTRRLTLLKSLKQGYIDGTTWSSFMDEAEPASEEDIEREVEELTAIYEQYKQRKAQEAGQC